MRKSKVYIIKGNKNIRKSKVYIIKGNKNIRKSTVYIIKVTKSNQSLRPVISSFLGTD